MQKPNSQSLTRGIKPTLAQGCRTGPPTYTQPSGQYDNPLPQSTLSLQVEIKNWALVYQMKYACNSCRLKKKMQKKISDYLGRIRKRMPFTLQCCMDSKFELDKYKRTQLYFPSIIEINLYKKYIHRKRDLKTAKLRACSYIKNIVLSQTNYYQFCEQTVFQNQETLQFQVFFQVNISILVLCLDWNAEKFQPYVDHCLKVYKIISPQQERL